MPIYRAVSIPEKHIHVAITQLTFTFHAALIMISLYKHGRQ